jgi:DNA-binding Lrp family transcriptional regulator
MAKKTYEQELKEKKEKLENLLSEKIWWSNNRAKRIEELENELKKYPDSFILNDELQRVKAMKDEEDLMIECLQDSIEKIDEALRESGLGLE